MNRSVMKKISSSVYTIRFLIIIASLLLINLLISLYFNSHFFFHTQINGVDLSLKDYKEADRFISDHIDHYKLKLIERNGETEVITGREIGMEYNKKNHITKVHDLQDSLLWFGALFKDQRYVVNDLFIINEDQLIKRISKLNCINNVIFEPQNVDFMYNNGSYEVVKEVYGNKLNRKKLDDNIKKFIVNGIITLDLDANHCYENPRYLIGSKKTQLTLNLLNKYVSTKITYQFGSKNEILDGKTLHKWLSVNNDLEVVLDQTAVMKYVKSMSKKYDTVGITRSFQTSTGKVVEVNGGIYGWKIDQKEETRELLDNIKKGANIEKEPIYSQRAISREGNEIGNTYVEINISKQHLWFYKDGKLIIQGAVVTGNPNKGNATVVGTYMLNYKQNKAILKGPGYEVEVKYWMPFFGNMGIHDAYWRYSFGGDIYKRNGTHGCVNAPLYLAKTIFKNIEVGTPVICYEE